MPPRKSEHQGRCLCGGVAYTVLGTLRDVWNCHCERCRRTTGHFMAATQAAVTDLRMDAEATLRWYTPEDEPRVSYGFCDRCGGSVFWQVKGAAQISICAGTLDQPTGLTTAAELFAGEVADYGTPAAAFRSFKRDRVQREDSSRPTHQRRPRPRRPRPG